KPTGISLAAPGTVVGAAAVSSERTGPKPSAGQARIALSQTTGPLPRSERGPAAAPVPVFDDGDRGFSVHVAAPRDHGTCATDVVTHLLRALEHARQEAAVKVLRLSGLEHHFPGGGRGAYNDAVSQGLYRALVSFPYPVIAVLEGDTSGAAFMAAAL